MSSICRVIKEADEMVTTKKAYHSHLWWSLKMRFDITFKIDIIIHLRIATCVSCRASWRWSVVWFESYHSLLDTTWFSNYINSIVCFSVLFVMKMVYSLINLYINYSNVYLMCHLITRFSEVFNMHIK